MHFLIYSLADFVESLGFGDESELAFGDSCIPLGCSGVEGLSFPWLGEFPPCDTIWSKAALSVLTLDIRLVSADFSEMILA